MLRAAALHAVLIAVVLVANDPSGAGVAVAVVVAVVVVANDPSGAGVAVAVVVAVVVLYVQDTM
ncbi:hypothetical protein EMGBS3_08770 [Anaerolineaceae bacterium]|nr:hypothetical protein EMGBS3_08770 [Anaerolineaceae bacterium]